MINKQSLSIEQRLGLKMSPKQMQLMRLLQVPSAELLTSIREEMENNPALEEEADEEHDNADDTDNTGEGESNEDSKEDILEDYFNEDESDSYRERSVQQEEKYRRPAIEQASFQEQVMQQFRLLHTNNLQRIIGEVIIGNLDDDGYLARSVEAIVNDLAFSQNISVSQNQVEDVLKIIQTLEPSGIGARYLRECLQIQLQRYDTLAQNVPYNILTLAQKIVSNDTRFDEFTSRKYDLLIKRFKVSSEDFKDAVSLITRLNPKPGGGAETNTRMLNPVVIPDFSISVFGNEITISLNNDYVPDLRVNPAYQQMLNEYSSEKSAVSFIKQKIENARSFIELIKERQNTLLNVMQTIVNLQRNYFLTGERSQLKPMILKDVAETTKLDISTVSRITSNKYAQTPYGIILLKDFFSQALQNEEGNDVSSIEVKDALKKIITSENSQKPFTDDALVVEMKKNGYTISRRTITKYRELLSIPVARLRRSVM